MTEILILCTANRCRSVMAESLLSRCLVAAGLPASVSSAGLLGNGAPPPPEVLSALAAYGLDAAAHRARAFGDDDLAGSDLVLAMAREHLRHAVVALPAVWPRAFTLKELVRRGQQIGPRLAGEPLAGWVRRAHQGRDRAALLGDSPDDDVADPTGGPLPQYALTAAELDHLLAQLVELAWA
jgi:low molecular weight protein-tyrosine phosphatase